MTAPAYASWPTGYIFTFGIASPLADRYVALRGDDSETRRLMQQIFAGNWSTQYDIARGVSVVRRQKLRRLELGLAGEFSPVPPLPGNVPDAPETR
jgi:hypothetical protein